MKAVHDLPLLPRPKSVHAGTFDSGKLDKKADVHFEASLSRPAEYKLTLSPKGPFIVAGGPDGVRAAERTLKQLRAIAAQRPKERPLPILLIEDWADHERRGFMLDVSRDRIPTMATLRELVAALARTGYNELQLYVEHTFAYPGHEAVWGALDALTPDQVREIDGLCRSHGIELVANQNCFGHLAGWLRTPGYTELAETHGTFRFLDFEKQGPFSLCPLEPRSLELVKEWLAVLARTFTSRRVNIGCDETFDVGQGKSRAVVERDGRAAVYTRFVGDVARAALALGLEPHFWADIALSDEEAFTRLPEELVPIAWGYEPDSPFEQWCTTLERLGRGHLVAPGTSCWRTFAGRTSERRANLAAASASAFDHDSDGLLVTAWGDIGHRQTWPITLRALADGAEACWNAGASQADPRAASRELFGVDDASVATWIDELGDLDHTLRTADEALALPRLGNASATFSELFPATAQSKPRGDVERWSACRERLDAHARSRPRSVDALVSAELDHAVRWSRLASDAALVRLGATPARRAALLEQVDALTASERELWPQRSRRPGLEHSLVHVAKLRERLVALERHA
jgi:hypothetical protein